MYVNLYISSQVAQSLLELQAKAWVDVFIGGYQASGLKSPLKVFLIQTQSLRAHENEVIYDDFLAVFGTHIACGTNLPER